MAACVGGERRFATKLYFAYALPLQEEEMKAACLQDARFMEQVQRHADPAWANDNPFLGLSPQAVADFFAKERRRLGRHFLAIVARHAPEVRLFRPYYGAVPAAGAGAPAALARPDPDMLHFLGFLQAEEQYGPSDAAGKRVVFALDDLKPSPQQKTRLVELKAKFRLEGPPGRYLLTRYADEDYISA